jgi:predicted GIY-YIG superfamily endonuclease
MKASWTYIVKCSDGLYYTGCTTSIKKRISEHNLGIYCGFTSRRRPVKLVWSQEFPEIRFAIQAERQIKGWTRNKKQALINGDFELLHKLAKSTEARKRKKNHASP